VEIFKVFLHNNDSTHLLLSPTDNNMATNLNRPKTKKPDICVSGF